MTKEELKKTIDIVTGIDIHSEAEATAKEELMSYAEQLQQENEELKKQVKIKNDGFMASINETCEYATILTEFEKWLDLEIEKYNALINPKKSTKPYGLELDIYENTRNRYMDCKLILQELKEGKK